MADASLLTVPRADAGAAASSARRWLRSTNVATAAALVGAVVIAPQGASRPDLALGVALFVGSSTHVAASAWLGTVGSARDCARRHPLRVVVAPACCIAVGALVGALTDQRALSFVLAGFFSWQFFHFAKQNLGIAALASASQGAGPLREVERRCLLASGVAGIVGLLARPSLLQLHEHVASRSLFLAASVGFVASVVVGVMAFARRARADRSSPVGITYGLGLVFSAPIFLFGSPYAAVAGMTIAHGLQYLGIVTLVASGPAARTHRIGWVVALFNVALLGGAVLATASHLHGDPGAGRVIFGVYLGILSTHFLVDGGLWRLSDPAARRFVTTALPDLVGRPRGRGLAAPVAPSRSAADI